VLYDLVCSVNSRIITGDSLSNQEKNNAIDTILSSRNLEDMVLKSARKLDSKNISSRTAMYPAIFIPTDEERDSRLRLITGELPKTKILSDNAYELEIMRLIALWGRGKEKADDILKITEKRLAKACFSTFCSKGECTGAVMAFLRFWAAYKPDDIERQKEIIAQMKPYRDGRSSWRKGLDLPLFYTFSAFSECAYEAVEEELLYCKNLLWNSLNRPWLNEPYNLLRKYVVKNALCRIPEYEFVENTNFYIGDDGRWHAEIIKT